MQTNANTYVLVSLAIDCIPYNYITIAIDSIFYSSSVMKPEHIIVFNQAVQLNMKAAARIYSYIWQQYNDSLANPFNSRGKHKAVYSDNSTL